MPWAHKIRSCRKSGKSPRAPRKWWERSLWKGWREQGMPRKLKVSGEIRQ